MHGSLYQSLLGIEFDQLPPTLQRLHDGRATTRAAGRLDIETNDSWVGKALVRLLGLPRSEKDVGVRLTVTAHRNGERWERWFGDQRFISWQRRRRDMFVESFGLLAVGFDLVASEAGLRFVQKRTWWLGIPWPRSLGPRVEAVEAPAADGWKVDIRLALPLFGPLLRYHGIMRQE
jgi:Domain of unknown function (DUF4166)